MPDAGLHPHREAMHKQHIEPGPSCCVPFGDPHVHKVTPSGETRQECIHSSANTMGTSPPYGEGTPGRRQVQRKEKEGGTSAKGSVQMLTCVPLPHLVLPLSGCACSGTPTKVRTGDTHDSGFAASRVSPCQTSNANFAMAQRGYRHYDWGDSRGRHVSMGAAMVYRTSGRKGPSPQRHKPTKECQRVVPSSSQPSPTIWGNQCGSDDRD